MNIRDFIRAVGVVALLAWPTLAMAAPVTAEQHARAATELKALGEMRSVATVGDAIVVAQQGNRGNRSGRGKGGGGQSQANTNAGGGNPPANANRGGNRRSSKKGAVAAGIAIGILGAIAASQAAKSEPAYRERGSGRGECRRYRRRCEDGSRWSCRQFRRYC